MTASISMLTPVFFSCFAVGYSTVLLTISITPTTNPSILVFPTPLIPEVDPRTAKPGTEGMILQLWKIEVIDYSEEAIKSSGVKGFYGFVRLIFSAPRALLSWSLTFPLFSPTPLQLFFQPQHQYSLSLRQPWPSSPTSPSPLHRHPFLLLHTYLSTLRSLRVSLSPLKEVW